MSGFNDAQVAQAAAERRKHAAADVEAVEITVVRIGEPWWIARTPWIGTEVVVGAGESALDAVRAVLVQLGFHDETPDQQVRDSSPSGDCRCPQILTPYDFDGAADYREACRQADCPVHR